MSDARSGGIKPAIEAVEDRSITEHEDTTDAHHAKYTDAEAVAALANTHMARVYLNVDQDDIPDGKFCRIEFDAEDYDPGNNFSVAADLITGTADSGTNATTLVDAAVSFGADNNAFLALGLLGARVTSPTGGAKEAYIQSWVNATTVTIVMATGSAFTTGDVYHINHAEYTVPVSGYYDVSAALGWEFNTLIVDKVYRCILYVNGLARIDNSFHTSHIRQLTNPVSGDLPLNAGDVVTFAAIQYSGASTTDIDGGVTYITWFSIHLIQAY